MGRFQQNLRHFINHQHKLMKKICTRLKHPQKQHHKAQLMRTMHPLFTPYKCKTTNSNCPFLDHIDTKNPRKPCIWRGNIMGPPKNCAISSHTATAPKTKLCLCHLNMSSSTLLSSNAPIRFNLNCFGFYLEHTSNTNLHPNASARVKTAF